MVVMMAIGLLAVVKSASANEFTRYLQPNLPREGWGSHAIAINKQSWARFASEPSYTAESLLNAIARLLKRYSSEPFELYLADMAEEGSGHQLWPKNATAVIYTRYSGYIPYAHGFSSLSDVKMAARAIARFASASLLLGNPADVRVVKRGEEEIQEMVEATDPPKPVMLMFTSFTSPQSVRTRPFFEAAATLYRGQVLFAEVKCAGRGSNTLAQAYCKKMGVSSYPTLGLYTVSGAGVVVVIGGGGLRRLSLRFLSLVVIVLFRSSFPFFLQGQVWRPYHSAEEGANSRKSSSLTTGDIELFLWRNKPYFPTELLKTASSSASAASGLSEEDEEEDRGRADAGEKIEVEMKLEDPASASSSSSSSSARSPTGESRNAQKDHCGSCEATVAALAERIRRLEDNLASLERRLSSRRE